MMYVLKPRLGKFKFVDDEVTLGWDGCLLDKDLPCTSGRRWYDFDARLGMRMRGPRWE
jgi:hypothetical protein